MKKMTAALCVLLSIFVLPACGQTQSESAPQPVTETASGQVPQASEPESAADAVRRIRVQANGNTIVFELNDSQAAQALYEQLPLTVEVENFSTNEKIFYPPEELAVANTPAAESGDAGILAYYAPWGDVVLFYDDFRSASGLYELGHAVSGSEHISAMSGTIQIERTEN